MDHSTAHKVTALLARGGLDWQYLLTAAASHGVTGLLSHNLPMVGGNLLPEKVKSELLAENQENTQRSLALAGALRKIVSAFAEQGISSVPFKGPTLALVAYEDLGLRQFADLDILIHEQDFPRAKQTLANCGFAPVPQLDCGREAALLRFDSACGFRNGREVFLDIHWRFAPAYFGLQLETKGMWRRLQTVSFGVHSVPTLSVEDLLLVLCCHGFTHSWVRLGWICDIAGLIETQKNLDWNAVMERAAKCGVQRILSLGLLLANGILGAELPNDILKSAQRDSFVRKYAVRLQGNLSVEQSEAGIIGTAAFHLGMRERRRDKVRSFFNLVATPRSYDWMFASVPRSFGFLYYLIRPIRMAKAHGSRLTNAGAA
ncbi:MAG TPA: nucleotidyltransferase family protein [Candidatus Binatia bacterium]|jgi:hypothetical protein